MHIETTDPDRSLERTGDELEERIERLDDHIDDSKKELTARREEADEPSEKTAGDWEDTDDDAGGEDPSGFDDPESEDDEDDE
ncbi:MAG: hypothetical protein QOH46_3422 [Solirubrobacteraceae bacterium]|nr:hypothetical protein [Solirubrobacteraceae bacterium]